MSKSNHYYTVALTIGATWRKNEFTYNYHELLEVGSVVVVPFGKTNQLGFVVSQTSKPLVKTKPISMQINVQLPEESIKLYQWLSEQYPNLPGSHLQHILPAFLKQKSKEETNEINNKTKRIKSPDLTTTQANAVRDINSTDVTTVLHGITGSGKTRVYIELIRKILQMKKNVLLVYPEISLTPLIEQALGEIFGEDKVLIFHSKKSKSKLRSTWLKISNSNENKVIIGPRSSLFLPHHNLGLIVVDEAHDSSYKQDNGSRYNGLNVAAAIAKIHRAKLILGSATPPIQETHQILKKGGQLVCMHDLAISHDHGGKDFSTVDMTKKNNTSKKSFMFSNKLLEEINNGLTNNMQALIFLNRRGTAHVLMCENCGWHAECPRCEMPLTYHHDKHKVRCHLCGYSANSPNVCPDCNSNLSQKSLGTKSIENELKSLFPSASISRFDSDNKKGDSLTENYKSIKNGSVDILIGTQLVTKGLDLPKLQTVGILQADSQLFLPDFSSEERAFQQLTQVSGRVGRGHSQGHVVLQTHQLGNEIFDSVREGDWHNFYNQQINKRMKLKYPPFSYFMKITSAKSTPIAAENSLQKFIKENQDVSKYRIFGPAPSFYAKRSNKYVWQLTIRSASRKNLVELAKKLPKDLVYDLDPISLL